VNFGKSAIKLACEIVMRGVLTEEELEAIMRSGIAPREIVEAVNMTRNKKAQSTRGRKGGGHEGSRQKEKKGGKKKRGD